uniref:Uncharacterized protein n=1 Tax=Ditylenchus dipsaci TaxID=166011 RepID=A0A915DGS5_9BILA
MDYEQYSRKSDQQHYSIQQSSQWNKQQGSPSIAPTTQEQVASSYGYEEISTSSASPYKQYKYLDEGNRMEELDDGGLYMIYSDQPPRPVQLDSKFHAEHNGAGLIRFDPY